MAKLGPRRWSRSLSTRTSENVCDTYKSWTSREGRHTYFLKCQLPQKWLFFSPHPKYPATQRYCFCEYYSPHLRPIISERQPPGSWPGPPSGASACTVKPSILASQGKLLSRMQMCPRHCPASHSCLCHWCSPRSRSPLPPPRPWHSFLWPTRDTWCWKPWTVSSTHDFR